MAASAADAASTFCVAYTKMDRVEFNAHYGRPGLPGPVPHLLNVHCSGLNIALGSSSLRLNALLSSTPQSQHVASCI